MRMNPALIAGKLFALALFTAGAVDAARSRRIGLECVENRAGGTDSAN